jgi:hypothetical protein
MGVVAIATVALSASPSWGAAVTADAFLPKIGAPLGPGATFDLRAFSVSFAPVLAGPNSIPGDGGTPSLAPIIVFSLVPRIYFPTIEKSGLKAGTLNAFTSSTSPPAAPVADGVATFSTGGVFPPGITAQGVVPAAVKGAAAGQAVDPYPLSPGDYDYSYTVDSLTLMLDAPDEVGASYFATDSRFSDPLWSLGISAQGVLNSNADLVIDFQSNPILGLDDSLIDSEVRAAFSVSSGTAVLDDFELFNTTYLVDRPITYAEGVNADVEPIREPSALALLVSALALSAVACGFRGRA